MTHARQKVLSGVIGLILAALLLYIGFRIVQQRASRASIPNSFTAERVDIDTCRVTAVTTTDEPVLLRYGEPTPTFYFRMEAANISPQGDGAFTQEADINNLGSGQITFLVENHEDVKTTCDPHTGGGAADEAAADPLLDEGLVPVEPTRAPALTEEPLEPLEDEEPTPTESEFVSYDPLDRETADAYFEENEDADVLDCVDEFKNDYYGVVQMCNEAYRDSEA